MLIMLIMLVVGLQVKDTQGLLLNHDNVEPLHYEDDWFIVAADPDKYIFVYYKGNNDAWKGYGGSTVYTRQALYRWAPLLSPSYSGAGFPPGPLPEP